MNAGFKDLLTKMINKDPVKRITLEEMMRHPWVTEEGKHIIKKLEMPNIVITKKDIDSAIMKKSIMANFFAVTKMKTKIFKRNQTKMMGN